MDYVYAAIFEPNEDGTFTITFPDLPGCISEGNDLPDALRMAENGLSLYVECMKNDGIDFPAPTALDKIKTPKGAFANLVRGTIRDNAAIRKTVSIPRWMDEQASAAGLSLSRVLQEALKARLL